MQKLGFDERWMSLIMMCVNSVSFQIKVNGERLENFKPSRGIRQGDPISPYLFLLCGEGLSSLLKNYDGGWVDRGIRVSPWSPWISHLLFADDCLVFIKADDRSAQRLNTILDIYSTGSGQSANKMKSSVYCSPNCSAQSRAAVQGTLQIDREALSEKYLGLPTASGRITEEQFEHLVEKSRSKAQGWSEKKLACAAREVLIKSVIQALPANSMSCFKLTRGLCRKVTAVMSKYWWAGSLDKSGMHWQSWDKLAVPKGQGGLGFRDLEKFNDAMLAKQAWRLLERPDSLCARVLLGRYNKGGDMLTASCPHGASATWKAIIKGREVLKKGLIRKIGNSRTTKIWHDQWIDGTLNMKPLGRASEEPVQLVSDLLEEDSNQWDVEKVQRIFFPLDAAAILSMPRPRSEQADFWAWAWDKTGVFTVRSAYKELVQIDGLPEPAGGSSTNDEPTWKSLWKLKVMPKIRVFWWRVVKNLLPCAAELRRRHIKEISVCMLCGNDNETLFHALIECEHARASGELRVTIWL
jgi:hypothetical protein